MENGERVVSSSTKYITSFVSDFSNHISCIYLTFHLSAKADITQILQTMANIYSRSGDADFQHKEVEDIANAWKESFASGDESRKN